MNYLFLRRTTRSVLHLQPKNKATRIVRHASALTNRLNTITHTRYTLLEPFIFSLAFVGSNDGNEAEPKCSKGTDALPDSMPANLSAKAIFFILILPASFVASRVSSGHPRRSPCFARGGRHPSVCSSAVPPLSFVFRPASVRATP